MYQKIKKILDGEDIGKMVTSAGTAIAGAAAAGLTLSKGIKSARGYSVARKSNLGKIGDAAFHSKFKASPSSNFVSSVGGIPGLIKAAVGLIGGVVGAISLYRATPRNRKIVKTLTQCVLQGDIDVSELFTYANYANKREKGIIAKVLTNLGYSGENISTFIGEFRGRKASLYAKGVKL